MAISWILDEGAGSLPGLRIGIVPNQARRTRQPTVAAFIGFGTDSRPAAERRARGPAAERGISCRRYADFSRAVRPDAHSFLGAAVRGFFANGGQECAVFPLDSHAAEPAGPAAAGDLRLVELRRLLERGGWLEDRVDVALVCMPDAVSADLFTPECRTEAQALQVRHCETAGDRFAIVDTPGPASMQEAHADHPLPAVPDTLRSSFAAMYYPWVIPDRMRDGRSDVPATTVQWRRGAPAAYRDRRTTAVPPCGHVAGLYARADRRHGQHRSPANMTVFGARELTRDATLAEMSSLAERRVNCIAHVPAMGLRVTDARTLSFHERNPFVSTKRVLLDLRRWLEHGFADLVFETNSPTLRRTVRDRLELHCTRLWESGALVGRSPGEAFTVKCDAETNPPTASDTGLLVAEVGIAISVPAEFVEVRVVRDAYGFTVTGQ